MDVGRGNTELRVLYKCTGFIVVHIICHCMVTVLYYSVVV